MCRKRNTLFHAATLPGSARNSGAGIAFPDRQPWAIERLPSTQYSERASRNPYATISSVSVFDSTIAALIDHTLLKPEATAGDIRKLCTEARQYGFATVCVNPYWVRLIAGEL